MYKFFVNGEQIGDNEIEITNDDVNHIKNVLRLRIGDKIEICNISNSENFLCKITKLDSEFVKCSILEKIESNSEANVYLHIFQGLPKADKMETIIEKCTEIGVSEITPVIMKRCVVKLDDKTSYKKNLRWQKIAEVAAKQSKRDKIPQVNLPISIKNIYEKIEKYDIVLVAYENEKKTNIKEVLEGLKPKQKINIAVIIGPEGGIEEDEIEDLRNIGANVITLGKRILRTETAPIVISSVIMYEFNEMV